MYADGDGLVLKASGRISMIQEPKETKWVPTPSGRKNVTFKDEESLTKVSISRIPKSMSPHLSKKNSNASSVHVLGIRGVYSNRRYSLMLDFSSRNRDFSNEIKTDKRGPNPRKRYSLQPNLNKIYSVLANNHRTGRRGSIVNSRAESIERYSHILKVQSGLSALAKWKVKTKTTATPTKAPPIVKFRSYARLAVLCARLCKYSHENIDTGKSDFLSIIQNIDEFVPILARDGLFFDPKIYRANKEDRLPAEARNLLKRPQHLRTKKDNQYLQIILRSIKAFAEYPNKMQTSLCQVGWYEAYEPKRVIVRQGQPPHTFYFILSGSVIVTTFDSTAGEKRFLVSLHRGMSFGELAVITRSKRQATVSTSTAAEFLCISAKDFEDIFMAGGIKSVTDPDHNSFIRSIPFLKHWPLEILPRFPQACVFHFFPGIAV
ncbi:hypothetical protein CHS0354_019508 [Potamilus streckersoni]|uniref:Cyclic nucleotide-binding domain-containing protein n=1 Tax=Potamilus streckersoni TaxID=2493646 RepID=A0AAE0SHD1_9BIVA|nr:hypothetical protein CHS0354_019508 [Potamilus streckersoni]